MFCLVHIFIVPMLMSIDHKQDFYSLWSRCQTSAVSLFCKCIELLKITENLSEKYGYCLLPCNIFPELNLYIYGPCVGMYSFRTGTSIWVRKWLLLRRFYLYPSSQILLQCDWNSTPHNLDLPIFALVYCGLTLDMMVKFEHHKRWWPVYSFIGIQVSMIKTLPTIEN